MATSPSALSSGADAPPISSGGDISSELGQVLSDAYDSAAGSQETPPQGDETPGGEAPAAGEPPIAETEETPGGEAPTAQTQPGAEPASPYPLTEDGKSHLVPKAALPDLIAAQHFKQQVEQFFASPQEAQMAYLQSSDHRAMGNDWMNGSDAALRGVLAHWAGANHSANPAVQFKYQQSFSRAASMIPDVLAQINPQAYQQFEQGMMTRAIDRAYGRAAETGNPEDLKRAQELDWGVTGQYKTALPAADPVARQQAQLQSQQQQFEQRQETAMRRDVGAFNNTQVEGAKFAQLNALIDQTLAPIKDRYPEKAFADLRAGIQREVVDALKGQPEWWLEHQQMWDGLISDYRTTWRQGTPGANLQPRVTAYVNDFVSRAKRFLPAIAKDRIGQMTAAAVTRKTAGQPTRTNGQARPATPANGQPAKKLTSEEWDAALAKEFAGFR
jgi:hypothetical protein